MVATGKHNGQLGRRSLPALAPWAVLALGLATTAWLTAPAYREMAARDEERFEHEVEHLVSKLEARLRTYGQALIGMRDWYSGHAEMKEKEWSHYIYTFHAPAHYPGLYKSGFRRIRAGYCSATRIPEAGGSP